MERDPPVTTPTMYIIVVTVRVLYVPNSHDGPAAEDTDTDHCTTATTNNCAPGG